MNILVAEDEPVARLVLESAIRSLGHTCMVAADGLDAWDLFQSCEPDVVISDWRMPGLDGTELCARVRTHDSQRYTPFIFVTVLSDKQHALEAMQAGADDYLTKPLDVDELRGRLTTAQRLKRVEEERRRLFEQERAARTQAELAIRGRDEILTALSHDLLSGLSGANISAQLLRNKARRGEQALPDVLKLATNLVDATARMAVWIGDLVDATHLKAGQSLKLNLAHIDLCELVRGAVEDHQAQTDQHQIELRISADSAVGVWDGPRLRRVLDNLLSNAIKYSPAGGLIAVAIEVQDAPAKLVAVSVRDQGIGIPAAELHTVFEHDRRASNVAGIPGQGVGLAGARQIVLQHAGHIDVHSQEGVGTTFTVRLPIVDEDSTELTGSTVRRQPPMTPPPHC